MNNDMQAVEKLLLIRQMRQDKAGDHLRAAKQVLDDAVQELARCQSERDRFRQDRPMREFRLFNQVQGQKVKRSRVDQLQSDLLHLKSQEQMLEEKVLHQDKFRQDALETLRQAHEVYLKAVHAVEKLQEVRSQLTLYVNKDKERQADAEMEEFHSRPVFT